MSQHWRCFSSKMNTVPPPSHTCGLCWGVCWGGKYGCCWNCCSLIISAISARLAICWIKRRLRAEACCWVAIVTRTCCSCCCCCFCIVANLQVHITCIRKSCPIWKLQNDISKPPNGMVKPSSSYFLSYNKFIHYDSRLWTKKLIHMVCLGTA